LDTHKGYVYKSQDLTIEMVRGREVTDFQYDMVDSSEVHENLLAIKVQA
jgi:hypothetical protein